MDSFRNTRTTCQNIKNTRTNNSNTSLVKIILMFNRFDSAMKTTTTTTKKTEDRPAAASRTPKQQEFHFRNKTKKKRRNKTERGITFFGAAIGTRTSRERRLHRNATVQERQTRKLKPRDATIPLLPLFYQPSNSFDFFLIPLWCSSVLTETQHTKQRSWSILNKRQRWARTPRTKSLS